MRVIGHGIDVAETTRIARMLDEHGQRFLDRVYTPREQENGRHITAQARREQYFTGRFAAKEAILKALGTGWREGIAWTDAEILRLPSGEPIVEVHGLVSEWAGRKGILRWIISISHTGSIATASALALGD